MRFPRLCCFRTANHFYVIRRVRRFWQGWPCADVTAYRGCRRCGRIQQM